MQHAFTCIEKEMENATQVFSHARYEMKLQILIQDTDGMIQFYERLKCDGCHTEYSEALFGVVTLFNHL